MKIVGDHQHEATILDWLSRRYGVAVYQTPRAVLGVIDDEGVLRGCFVVTWKNDTTAELHLYGKTSNDVWKAFFRLVFLEWGIWRLEVRTARNRHKMKRVIPKFGFRFHAVEREYYGPKQDAFAYTMTPNECRWIYGLTVHDAEGARAA
jgi:hypothetical protein